jgi:nitronate monooxygenase
MKEPLRRAGAFQRRNGLDLPILLAPMAGACAPSVSIAIANAGSMGACGALLMKPGEISAWASEVRAASNGNFQMNLWIPDPPPHRDADHEARVRAFLAQWGPDIPAEAGDATPPNFADQCQALLDIKPPVVSSVMGLYPAEFVAEMKRRGIQWFATITTLAEARAAAAAGADAVIAQGMEAGGHRGAFEAQNAERRLVGLFSLLPAVADAVKIPVLAAGGIADARGVVAALALGASAVLIGTGFLRCPEAKISSAWADALARTAPEDTIITRAFSGRAGRSIATDYVRAASATDAPAPAPYPVQRGLTAAMRADAAKNGDLRRMQAWAGQSAALAQSIPAADLIRQIWAEARAMLE